MLKNCTQQIDSCTKRHAQAAVSCVMAILNTGAQLSLALHFLRYASTNSGARCVEAAPHSHGLGQTKRWLRHMVLPACP